MVKQEESEEEVKIRYRNLSFPLKIAIIAGWIFLVAWAINVILSYYLGA